MRLEPIILELEREQNDLLIIAHDSVLKVLYGYLMACTAADIPRLEFPRNQIVEVRLARYSCTIALAEAPQIIPASYNNEAKRIIVPGVKEEHIPGSPENIMIPVSSPLSMSGRQTPRMANLTMLPPTASVAGQDRLVPQS